MGMWYSGGHEAEIIQSMYKISARKNISQSFLQAVSFFLIGSTDIQGREIACPGLELLLMIYVEQGKDLEIKQGKGGTARGMGSRSRCRSVDWKNRSQKRKENRQAK